MSDERLKDLWKTTEEGRTADQDPFFDEMLMGKEAQGGAIDQFLDEAVEKRLTPAGLEGEKFTAVRELAEARSVKASIPLDAKAGTRVRFGGSLEAMLTYSNAPDPGMEGTVVTVRTSGGDTTFQDKRLFVKWDNGEFMAALPIHLEAGKTSKRASMVRMSFSTLGDISGMFASTDREDELVHRATKDLWSFKKEGDQYVLQRLFDENGGPLKV